MWDSTSWLPLMFSNGFSKQSVFESRVEGETKLRALEDDEREDGALNSTIFDILKLNFLG